MSDITEIRSHNIGSDRTSPCILNSSNNSDNLTNNRYLHKRSAFLIISRPLAAILST
jgi:hypothetical protein